MSTITNLILSVSILEDSEYTIGKVSTDFIKKVNEYFKGEDVYSPIGFVENKLPDEAIGGSHSLEVSIYIGAFNCFDVDDFVKYLKTLSFESPEEVQVIVKGHDWERFKIINVFDKK